MERYITISELLSFANGKKIDIHFTHFAGMQSEIDNILTSAEAQKTNGYFVVDEMRKLRKALTNYQSEMKTAERKLRMKEQEVSNNKSVVPTTNGVVIVNGVIGKNNPNTQSNCRKVSEQSKGI